MEAGPGVTVIDRCSLSRMACVWHGRAEGKVAAVRLASVPLTAPGWLLKADDAEIPSVQRER